MKRLGGWWRLWIILSVVWGGYVVIDTFSNRPSLPLQFPPNMMMTIFFRPDSTSTPEERRQDSIRLASADARQQAELREANEAFPAQEREYFSTALLKLIGVPLLVVVAARLGLWVRRGFKLAT